MVMPDLLSSYKLELLYIAFEFKGDWQKQEKMKLLHADGTKQPGEQNIEAQTGTAFNAMKSKTNISKA